MRKRSIAVLLTLGAVSCSRSLAPDPCDKNSWSDDACRDAIQNRGYYSHGTFIPHFYPNPYPFYYDAYGSFLRGGGRPSSVVSPGAYAHPSGSSGVTRGGF